MLKKPRPLRSGLLLLCGTTVLLSMIAFAVFAGWVINSRITDDARQLLDRSITVAWQEYRRFLDEETRALQAAAAFPDTAAAFLRQDARFTALSPDADDDLRFAVSRQGEVFAVSGAAEGSVPQPLVQRTAGAWRSGAALTCSEALQLEDWPAFFSGALAEKAALQTDADAASAGTPVLLQLACVPVYGGDGQLLGCLAGVKLCNNDEALGRRYSAQVADSYLSISIGGRRIVSNIVGLGGESFVGLEAPQTLFETTQSGARYIGQTEPEMGSHHWVIAEPIRNASGEVIGALGIGILFQQVAVVSRNALSALLAALLVCLAFAFIMVLLLSRRISAPIIRLEQLASEISRAKAVCPEHL